MPDTLPTIESLGVELPMLAEFEAFFAIPVKMNDLSGFAVAALGMRAELLAVIQRQAREAERGREWDEAVSSIWQLDGVGPKTLRACIDAMSELQTQETDRAEQAQSQLAAVREEAKSHLAYIASIAKRGPGQIFTSEVLKYLARYQPADEVAP